MKSFSLFLKKTGWILAIVTIISIGLYPYIYLFVEWPFGLLMSKTAELLANKIWIFVFYLHILLGSISLLTGWSQFVPNWRKHQMTWHKTLGKVYVFSVFISGLAGFYIAYFATGGWITSLGFMSLAVLWLLSTFKAYQLILNKEFDRHEQMMIYSYAACLAAVTLRLWLPLLTYLTGDFFVAYPIVAWLCWMPNLIVAVVLVNKKKQSVAV